MRGSRDRPILITTLLFLGSVTCGHSLKSYYSPRGPGDIFKTFDYPHGFKGTGTSDVFRISWQTLWWWGEEEKKLLQLARRTRRIKFYANTSSSFSFSSSSFGCEQVHLIGCELKIIISIFPLQLKIKQAATPSWW